MDIDYNPFGENETNVWRLLENQDAYVRTLRNQLRNMTQTSQPITIELDELGGRNVINLIRRNLPQGNFIANAGDTYYMLNAVNLNRLDALFRDVLIEEQEQYGSDEEFIASIRNLNTITISGIRPQLEGFAFLPDEPARPQPSGAFFKHLHASQFDLTRYGIYSQFDKVHYQDNCLIYAMKVAEVPENKINLAKSVIVNDRVPTIKLKVISELIDMCIVIKKPTTKRFLYYGDKKLPELKLGLLEGHYFLLEKTPYRLKDLQNWRDFDGEIGEGATRSSYYVINYLLNQRGFFTPITYNDGVEQTIYHKSIKEYDTLEYDEKCVQLNECKPPKKNKKIPLNVFFDYETMNVPVDDGLIHRPYLCAVRSVLFSKVFYGEKCGELMLKYLCRVKYIQLCGCRLIAHNASYDFRFILGVCAVSRVRAILKGNNLMSASFKFGGCDFMVKDSKHLIQRKLIDFGDMFDLEQEKEVMPYKLYTPENVKKTFIPMEECLKYVGEADRSQYIENCKRWGDLVYDEEFDEVNIIEYSAKYCEIDCQVLMEGYNIFRGWFIQEPIALDIDNIISIPSCANQLFLREGVYDGVYKLSGVPRMFIQKCVIGGRCMTRFNRKYHRKYEMADYDAVSLYPSAMRRMEGFVKGVPKVITKDIDVWATDMFFVKVNIKRVPHKRAFPCITAYDGNTRSWVSRATEMYVDKYTLEDIIKFHRLEADDYEILEGYYYDEGFNSKINDVIQLLFEERAKRKKVDNKAETIFKLLMNAGYGKSIIKPIDEEVEIVSYKKLTSLVERHYHNILWFKEIPFSKKYIVKKITPINTHFNNVACGVNILSISKRIMNEVMCLAEDIGINIFYTDTDSIHIPNKSLPKLEKKFEEVYGRKLGGKGLGNFHTDFDFLKHKNVVAVESIFLGKKSYIDKLRGIDKNGKEVFGYHIRMKGITPGSLSYVSKQKYNDNPMKMYMDLKKGKKVAFDLTCGGEHTLFDFRNDMSVYVRNELTRKLVF